ncbi:hypothetical protein L873DRAFT_1904157 [Choiromyces venosus 120613-1]|uniref:Uncharacterized protein n=1 Tax=Choiromyces venosus 120613-1 TaxID=1336337 RepID=A0A3N4J4D5_9PEZI|nr:hypothetical protein L873DRAFT_1904157 [Choiromyces venosus 120613-1]
MPPAVSSGSPSDPSYWGSSHPDMPCPHTHLTRDSIPTAESAVISTPQWRLPTPGPSTIQTIVPQWSPISAGDMQGNTLSSRPSMPKLTYQARAGIKRLTGKELEHYGTSLSSTPRKQVAEVVNQLVTNISSKLERAKIMTRVLSTLQLQLEITDSTILVIWDTLSEHLLKKLTQIPKFWSADQVQQALRHQVKLRAKGGRRGVQTTPLIMPEDVSQVMEKLAMLSSSNDNDVIEITVEAFDATFPLRQWSSTRFDREMEALKAVTTPAPQHQQVAGSKSKPRHNDKLDKGKGASAGDESGCQGEDLQEEEGISEDDQNQEGQDHSPLPSPDSESEPREVEEADHGITAGPDPLLDRSLPTCGQHDHDGDAAMMDASSLTSTSATHAEESRSTGSLSLDREQQLGFVPRGGPLPGAIPSLATGFPEELLLQWKRELDMHYSYAPTNPSNNGLLTTCFHSVVQQCLLQDPRLYLQAVHSHPERSQQLVGYPCPALYVAARNVPPPQFPDVNLEYNDTVGWEAIAGIVGQDSPERWKEQVLAALGGVSSGLARGQSVSGLDGGGLEGRVLTWQEMETQPVMICPVQLPLRISQMAQPKTLRYIDLDYITSVGEELELKWIGTHDSVSSLHCNQDIPSCLPSGDAIPGVEGLSERVPFSVELRGVWAVGDAILGLRSWDSPVVLEELRQLDNEGFVMDVLNQMTLRALECYAKLEEWKNLQGWVESDGTAAKRSRVTK